MQEFELSPHAPPFRSEAVKYGTFGALIGACAPALYTLLQLTIFYPGMSLSEYAGLVFHGSHKELAVQVFMASTVVIGGAAGALWGRLREKEALHRNESMAHDIQLSATKEDLQKKSIELEKTVHALKALVEVDQIIMSTPDRDEMLMKVASKIRELVPADVGGVALKNPDTGNHRLVGGWGIRIINVYTMLPGNAVSPEVSAGRSQLRGRLPEKGGTSLDKVLAGAGVRSDIQVSIRRDGAEVGFFFLGSFSEDGFDRENMKTAETFASRMGIALEHAKLIYGMEEMTVNIIHALATAIDAKSPWTKGHSERVSNYAMRIAIRMNADEPTVERLRLAGLLHDIGKIGTYDQLLDKEEKLTLDELELIKQHPVRGCEILGPIKELGDIVPAVMHHHERWDGGGYPAGLKGEDIPFMARVLCVADSFDTMTADRPYRPSIGFANAIEELKYCSGSQFAPEVVESFLGLLMEHGPEIIQMVDPLYRPASEPPANGAHGRP